jgi:hypothetical protein
VKTSQLPIARFAQVLLANAKSIDPRFRITSMYRSPAAQAKLYNAWLRRGKTGLPAAPPGHSMHELGQAVDIARGVDPFQDQVLAFLGSWWQSNGLGWSPSDPVHFQLAAIPQHAAGLASGERHTLRAPTPEGASELPIHHPAITRGLTSWTEPVGIIPQKRPDVLDVVKAAATSYAADALRKAPVLGSALDVVSLPFKLAGAPDVASQAANLAVNAPVAFVSSVLDAFGGGPQMTYTTAGGKELARRIKASLDLDDTGRATSSKWGTR